MRKARKAFAYPVDVNNQPRAKGASLRERAGKVYEKTFGRPVVALGAALGPSVAATAMRRNSSLSSCFAAARPHLSDTEHILHRIQTRRTALKPPRGRERASGEARAVVGTMTELDTLTGTGKQQGVIPNDVATTHH